MNECVAVNGKNALAEACQAKCSHCCKKGKIFLPEKEYLKILNWLEKNSPLDIEEFNARNHKFDGFYLYDQQNICQFLNAANLCRLHIHGVKPRECFWWPLHIYCAEADGFEIRVSTSCCEGYKHVTKESSEVLTLQAEVSSLGGELIKNRRVFESMTSSAV